jgi:hypothetical protein
VRASSDEPMVILGRSAHGGRKCSALTCRKGSPGNERTNDGADAGMSRKTDLADKPRHGIVDTVQLSSDRA